MTREQLIELLKAGTVSKNDLDSIFILDNPGFTPAQAEVARMNFIAGLRGEGYIIPRQRGVYHITGFEEKEEQLTADKWPEEKQKVLQWYGRLPRVQMGDSEEIRLYYRVAAMNRPYHHELSAGYLLTYELASDEARVYDKRLIIAKKFQWLPRFRIITPPVGFSHEHMEQIDLLQTVSTRKIKLVGASPDVDYSVYGFVKYGKSAQAVYDLDWIVNEYIGTLHKRERRYVRRAMEGMTFLSADYAYRSSDYSLGTWVADAKYVIDRWREGRSAKAQRKLAINRDYVAVDLCMTDPVIRKHSWVFYRDNQPVGLEMFDLTSGFTASHLVAKALNYPEQPGGLSMTASATLILAARNMLERGVLYANSGTYDGGEAGLYEHKKSLTKTTKDAYSYVWEYQPKRMAK